MSNFVKLNQMNHKIFLRNPSIKGGGGVTEFTDVFYKTVFDTVHKISSDTKPSKH